MIRYIIFWCVMQSVQAPPSQDEFGRVLSKEANTYKSQRFQQVFTDEKLAKEFYLKVRKQAYSDSVGKVVAHRVDSVSAIQIKDITWK